MAKAEANSINFIYKQSLTMSEHEHSIQVLSSNCRVPVGNHFVLTEPLAGGSEISTWHGAGKPSSIQRVSASAILRFDIKMKRRSHKSHKYVNLSLERRFALCGQVFYFFFYFFSIFISH